MTLETLAIHLDLPHLPPDSVSLPSCLPGSTPLKTDLAQSSHSPRLAAFFFFLYIWNCLASLYLCLFCFPVHNTVFFFVQLHVFRAAQLFLLASSFQLSAFFPPSSLHQPLPHLSLCSGPSIYITFTLICCRSFFTPPLPTPAPQFASSRGWTLY